MPTRYLKPGIRDSERIEAVKDSDAEILYYRLLSTVDDFGRFDARPKMVKSECFPIRDRATADKCMQWLHILENAGLLGLYEIGGKPYLQLAKWDNKPRAATSKFPDPPADVYKRMQMLPVTVTVTGTETKTKQPTKKTNGHSFEPPDWIPQMQWQAWIESRTKAKKAPTDFAKRLAVSKLDELREQGHHPAAVLAQSAFNGWSGLFPIKEQSK